MRSIPPPYTIYDAKAIRELNWQFFALKSRHMACKLLMQKEEISLYEANQKVLAYLELL